MSCHGSDRSVAGLQLDQILITDVGPDAEVWERVVRTLQAGTMPPMGAPRPEQPMLVGLASRLEQALDGLERVAETQALDPSALAGHLARLLWSTAPDDELSAAAANGSLRDPTVLAAQIRRMLGDPRAHAFVDGFFGDWLHLRNIASIDPDGDTFPNFDPALRAAFQTETTLFLASQLRDDRSVFELLTVNYTFVNERLAAHYGIPDVDGSEFRRVTPGGHQRHGLFGQGGWLSITSYPTRTSPVLRGKYVLEILLGVPPPPPVPNMPALTDEDDGPLRDRMEDHRRLPVCASCHAQMDAIGFAFEHFDGIGQWRDVDQGHPIDASGALADGTAFAGPTELVMALSGYREAYVRTVAEQLLVYALGRGTSYRDMPTVRTIVREAAPSDYRWSALIRGVVQSQPVQALPPVER